MEYIKPAGCTTVQFINKIKDNEKLDKITFSGRLDPMARGKILVFKNEECKLAKDYHSNKKTYQFEVIIGIKTDTDDALGIIDEYLIDNINNNVSDYILKIVDYVNNLDDNIFEQRYHDFSSKVFFKNKNFVDKNKLNLINKVQIYEKKIIGNNIYNYKNWIKNIIENINSIYNKNNSLSSYNSSPNSFRQDIIIDQWSKISNNNDYKKYIYSVKIELSVSSGFYVRQFVNDMSLKLNIPLMAYDINRIII
jgi:tRNA U55 pseudouridine synthase TruB